MVDERPRPGMPGQHSDADYVKELEATRREKDYFFREDDESPIPHAIRHEFKGLAYFRQDPKNRVRARLVRDSNPQHAVLATSKGEPRHMIRFCVSASEIDG